MPSQQPTIFRLPGHYADQIASNLQIDKRNPGFNLYAFLMLILFSPRGAREAAGRASKCIKQKFYWQTGLLPSP